jgi:hypothetical protein
MPYVAVPQIVLNQPRVRALVGQGEAASVPELVRVSGHGKPGQLPVIADRQPCLGDFDFIGFQRVAWWTIPF